MHGRIDRFQDRLIQWYDKARRDLPWRNLAPGTDAPDPYQVLVSELMLQQTQVATVIPYFRRFIDRLPTLQALAESDTQEVLRLWQGLGYYARARNLQKAAQEAVSRFGGRLPADLDDLLTLPGIGRYTAGAIASIAFGRRAPILDGNVMRVLCRIDAIKDDPRQPAIQKRLWERAEEILPQQRIGDFNSALMELGATVCTPRSPQCLICPVRDACEAANLDITDQIPPARKAAPTPLERRIVICIARGDQWLIEQRPATGRWAGLWQFITRPAPQRGTTVNLPVPVTRLRRLGQVRHQLTHRRYVFDARTATPADDAAPTLDATHRWVRLADLPSYPMSKPQLLIAQMLQAATAQS